MWSKIFSELNFTLCFILISITYPVVIVLKRMEVLLLYEKYFPPPPLYLLAGTWVNVASQATSKSWVDRNGQFHRADQRKNPEQRNFSQVK